MINVVKKSRTQLFLLLTGFLAAFFSMSTAYAEVDTSSASRTDPDAPDMIQDNRARHGDHSAKEHLCRVGLSLGGAFGRLKFFGKASGGTPPPDQVAAMATNLSNAIAEIEAFESLKSRLHKTERGDDAVRLIKDELRTLASTAGRLTFNDAHRISNVQGKYQQTIAYTYNSERGLVRGENCDTELIDTCYHFAAAHVASAFVRPIRQRVKADHGQSHHIGMMHRAIRDGIKLSFDNITGMYLPARRIDLPEEGGFEPNLRMCCSFGLEEGWEPILALEMNSTWQEMTNLEGYLRNFVGSIPDPDCTRRNSKCNETTKAGSNDRERIRIEVGGSRAVVLNYEMLRIQDRMILSYGGTVIHDTGCVSGSSSVELELSGTDDVVVVDVFPNCAGDVDTRWSFRLDCEEDTQTPAGDGVLAKETPGGACTLPDFTGKPLKEAAQWLEDNGLEVGFKPGSPAPSKNLAGTVEAQDPAAGTHADQGKKVSLTVHSAFVDTRKVPDVTGMSIPDAKAALGKQAFEARLSPGGSPPSRAGSGTIASQRPEPGATVKQGAEVTLKVYGRYVERNTVPEVGGLTAAQAKSRIAKAGLKPVIRTGGASPSPDKAGRVARLDPTPGTQTKPGTEVKIIVYGPYAGPRTDPPDKRDGGESIPQTIEDRIIGSEWGHRKWIFDNSEGREYVGVNTERLPGRLRFVKDGNRIVATVLEEFSSNYCPRAGGVCYEFIKKVDEGTFVARRFMKDGRSGYVYLRFTDVKKQWGPSYEGLALAEGELENEHDYHPGKPMNGTLWTSFGYRASPPSTDTGRSTGGGGGFDGNLEEGPIDSIGTFGQ